MVIMRLFSVTSLTLAFVGCGFFEGNNRREQAVQPLQVEQRTEVRDTRGADALFNEFFDVAPVQQEPAAPAPQQRVITPEPPRQIERNFTFTPSGRYVVQVSTVASPDLANNIARRFEGMGYPAYVARVENPTPALIGTFFRVRIGGFNRLSEANNFGESVLRPLGYDFWVDNRSNDNVGMGGGGLGFFDPGPITMSNPAPAPAPTPAPTPAPAPITPTVVSVSAPSSEFVPEAFNIDTPASPEGSSGWDNFDW
jgi:hypothetical protein